MTHTLEELIPDYIQGLPAYVPGKPVEEVEQDLKIHAVKLASNENPLGPSPKAMEAARHALGEANWYPDGGSKRLRQVLADRFHVRPEEVLLASVPARSSTSLRAFFFVPASMASPAKVPSLCLPSPFAPVAATSS